MNVAIDQFYGMTSTAKKYDAVIVGLGKTGLSCAGFFNNKKISIAINDSRQRPPGLEAHNNRFPHIPLYLGGFDPTLLCSAQELIVSPGISLSEPAIKMARQAGVKIVGDVEVFCRTATSPIVAVTGSNGKSTVATMIYRMIEVAGRTVKLGGNIGTPVLDLLAGEEPEYYVLEISSFQLESTSSLNASAAVVLNVTEDHMDRYASMGEYTQAKARIYNGTGTMVINLDDEIVASLPKHDRASICYTVQTPGDNAFGVVERKGEQYICRGDTVVCPVAALPIHGNHNLSNALAALALGSAIGLPLPDMLDGLRSFKGLPHRCQKIAQINGVDWINDSKATNVGACRAAIEGLAGDNNIVLIAGGEGKGADFSPLANCVAGRVRSAILLGRDAQRLADVLTGSTRIYFASDMEIAVRLAFEQAGPGDIVLLSPACASLDMYEDYQHRGNEFIGVVNRVCKR